ncbi:MAG: monovalent cation/H+ antiporter complex subunit F [Vallitaleaceae bacterium]|nr:monovalent cation/H+ antiporter complex subunit F [Vallitaleaceae bacterium]
MMIYVIFGFVAIGMIFSFVRLLKGPSALDRVVSLDTMNVIITGTIVLLAMLFENVLYLDIAIVYGVLAFLETIIIAKYMEAKV